MFAEVAQSTLIFSFFYVCLVPEYFWEGDEEVTAGSGYHWGFNAGHLAVLTFGFVQVLIILHICPRLISFDHTPKAGCLLRGGTSTLCQDL